METLIIILALIGAPVIGGLICLPFRSGRGIGVPVLVTSILMIFLSSLLLWDMHSLGISSLSIGEGSIDLVKWVILASDFALLVFFIVTGLRLRNWLVIIFGVLQLVPLAAIEASSFGVAVEPALFVDYLSVTLALVVSVIGSIICIYAIKYMQHDKAQPRFFVVMLLFLGAMNGAVFANNLLWLFFFWEVTTLCSYLLIGHERTKEAKESAVRALVYTLGGGVALIFGIVLANNYYHTLSMSDLLAGGATSGLALLPFALMAFAAFTKSAQMPFQSWLLGAMVAPTPVSALLHSSTMVKLGVYLLLRMSPAIVSVPALAWSIAAVGAFSFLGTSVLAMFESNSKRVLAYSTIANLGLITMCAGIDTSLAISAALILLVFHAVSKALLFMCVGAMKGETASLEIDDMAGLRDRMPFVSIAFTIGVITIMLPPFGMFASKWLLSEAITSLPILAFIVAVGFAATVVYYSKWLGRVLSGGSSVVRPGVIRDKLPVNYRYTLGSLAVMAVALSFLINYLVSYLINPYIETVFHVSVEGTGFSIFSSLGEFPIIVLLLLLAVTFVLIGIFLRPKQQELSAPYTGGESYQFETGSFYLLSKFNRDRAYAIFNLIAIVILAISFAIPFASEVIR